MDERALILDTGAVLAIIRRNARVLAFLEVAQRRGIPLVIPPVVVTQVIRGGPGDVRANRLFEPAYLSFVGPRLARVAGRLLAESGLSDAADAQIVADLGVRPRRHPTPNGGRAARARHRRVIADELMSIGKR